MKVFFKKLVNFIVYATILLLPFQVYFRIYKDKHISLELILIFCLFILNIDFFNIKKFISESSVKFFILFVFLFVLRGLFDKDKMESLKYGVFLMSGVVYSYVLTYSEVKKEDIINFLLFSTLPMVLFMFYTYFNESKEFDILKHPIMRIFIEPSTLERLISEYWMFNVLTPNRVGGFFTNVNICALFLGFIFLLSLLRVVISKGLLKKILFLIMSTLTLFGIIFTGSKGGLVTCIIVLCISSMLVLFKTNFYLNWKVVLSIFIAIFGIYVLLFNFNPRIKAVGNNDDFHGRKQIWLASIEVIKKNWILGVGLENKSWNEQYNIVAQKYLSSFNMPPHNMFLYIWSKGGIITVLLFFIFFVFRFVSSIRNFIEYHRFYSLLSFSCSLWLFIQGMVENFPLVEPRISILYWTVLALERK
ncbi:MAG: O-antigen ligase family protein [Endomicrobia bacterium]|nr:O-antigen ligase family protein [Endomicrobiia bacterium]